MRNFKKKYDRLYKSLKKSACWRGCVNLFVYISRLFVKKTFADYLLHYSKEERLSLVRRRSIERVANLLNDFQYREGVKITPENFNWTHSNNFIFYLQRKGYRTNTIFNMGSILKTYIRVLISEKINVNQAFLHIKLPREEYAGVVLNEKEICQIYYAQTPYVVPKIYFLIGCCTGLRESDFFRITKAHIRNGLIVIKNQKTKKVTYIPVHWIVKKIFEEFHYKLPVPCSAASFNISIKKICRQAGLTETIIMEYFQHGKLNTRTGPKYKFVSSHTARRTFISLLNDAGISLQSSAMLTSHVSLVNHLGYMTGKKRLTADELKMHPFFTGENVKEKLTT